MVEKMVLVRDKKRSFGAILTVCQKFLTASVTIYLQLN